MTAQNTPWDSHQPPNLAGWLRLAAAASIAGVSPDTLAGWIERGEIPVAMRQQGPRLRFVNGPQFDAWNGTPHSLYTPEDLARALRDYPPVSAVLRGIDLF